MRPLLSASSMSPVGAQILAWLLSNGPSCLSSDLTRRARDCCIESSRGTPRSSSRSLPWPYAVRGKNRVSYQRTIEVAQDMQPSSYGLGAGCRVRPTILSMQAHLGNGWIKRGQRRVNLSGVESAELPVSDDQHRQRCHPQRDQFLPRFRIAPHILVRERDHPLR